MAMSVSPSGLLKMGGVRKKAQTVREEHFADSLQSYKVRLEAFASTKKGSAKESLPRLDRWYRTELPRLVRSQKYLTLEQIAELTEWKMTRGLWRPRNLSLVKGNGDEKVVRLTGEATALCEGGDIEGALKKLMELEGVGPATSSAILACYSPSQVPFMSDEGLRAASVPLTYNVKSFRMYLSKMTEFAAIVQCRVSDLERSAWSLATAIKLDLDVVVRKDIVGSDEGVGGGGVGGKREEEKEETTQVSPQGPISTLKRQRQHHQTKAEIAVKREGDTMVNRGGGGSEGGGGVSSPPLKRVKLQLRLSDE
eukprot:TRINITY_DN9697_c0_g1_i1.p1 TRINITY_DN9697_c0_g1~~TRINITY_DN9697_c0_g1_i1.p1  ORF type:complete len:310 (+),score=63.72 TRINITY_DN9697_c0_g1_i1:50-979(+)